VINLDAAFGEELFHIAVRQSVAQVPAHSQQNDFGWEPVPGERSGLNTAGAIHHDTITELNPICQCNSARLRLMRGLGTDRTASVVIRGHAFMQNLRRGHYELGVEARHEHLRVVAAVEELAHAIRATRTCRPM